MRVFDELVRTLSKGVHYEKLEMASGQPEGRRNRRIQQPDFSLMRNLDESEWFESPNLRSIKEDPENSDYGGTGQHL